MTHPHQKSLFDTEPAPWEIDDAEEQFTATVVFGESPEGEFDYLIPEQLRSQVEPGRRLKVLLGRGNRAMIGYCIRAGFRRVSARQLKEVVAVVDPRPLLSPSMLDLAHWMAERYLCTLGQALEAIIPAGVRGQAGTREVTYLSVPTNVAARLTQLQLPKKQAEILKLLAGSRHPLLPNELAERAGCTLAPINELRKKKLIRTEVRREQFAEVLESPAPREEHWRMNDDQQAALDAVLGALKAQRHETILVHGVTGSGKTEVYIRAIEETLRYGRQAIVLVPEISLTPQTRQRFRARFEHVAVLHSHLTDSERHWHWQRISRGEVPVIVGARSAVFAPTPQLGLIVIDEEHDPSFKQDQAPRYHARDIAIQRATVAGVPLVLGSATPSLESWYAARGSQPTTSELTVVAGTAIPGQQTPDTNTGNKPVSHRLIEMPRRVLDRPLPDVATIDLRDESGRRGGISRPLYSAMDQALQAGGQIILLLNRRGFSTHIQCPACGHVVKCPNCDISLTHHLTGQKVLCHYCEHETVAPPRCPDCGFEGINYSGLGTQKLEEEVCKRFPHVATVRMDSDTMQKPGSHEQALQQFRTGEVRILLGTQMIAKGLDFPNVTLVGVINADTALHFPDFRAAERTFQLVTQVAGRTGRGERGGRVLVQTCSPDHPAILAAVKHDYHSFVEQELPARKEFGYPPVTSLIRLIVRGDSEPLAEQFAEQLVGRVRTAIPATDTTTRLLGPAAAQIAKLRGKFRFHALLFGEDGRSLRNYVRAASAGLKPPDDVHWVADVDPMDLL